MIPFPRVYAPETPPVGVATTRTSLQRVARLLLGEADSCDLRVGERHARDCHVVGERADLPAEDRVARESSLVLPHVRERRASVHVSDGVEPAALDAHGAEAVVDGDDAPGLQSDGLEAEVGGVRPTPDADE